jgi:deoxyribodipyrimidine photo-lyase
VTGVRYFPYVEPAADAGKGLLAELGRHACVIITDDYPAFFLPRMVAAAASRLPVRVEQVDSNGLLPLRATDRVFTTAFSFRSFLQKELPRHLVRRRMHWPG